MHTGRFASTTGRSPPHKNGYPRCWPECGPSGNPRRRRDICTSRPQQGPCLHREVAELWPLDDALQVWPEEARSPKSCRSLFPARSRRARGGASLARISTRKAAPPRAALFTGDSWEVGVQVSERSDVGFEELGWGVGKLAWPKFIADFGFAEYVAHLAPARQSAGLEFWGSWVECETRDASPQGEPWHERGPAATRDQSATHGLPVSVGACGQRCALDERAIWPWSPDQCGSGT